MKGIIECITLVLTLAGILSINFTVLAEVEGIHAIKGDEKVTTLPDKSGSFSQHA